MASTIYYLLSSALIQNDRKLILKLAENYSQIISSSGLQNLHKGISSEVFVSVKDSNGRVILNITPTKIEDEFDDLKNPESYDDLDEILFIKRTIHDQPVSPGWTQALIKEGDDKNIWDTIENALATFALDKNLEFLLPLIDNDILEIYTQRLADGGWIHIGKSSESREEYLAEIRQTSLVALIPFIVLGIILSVFLAWTILAPLKDLTQRVQRIQDGEKSLRAKNYGRGDEVDTLALKFNALLDQNEKLLENLKGTLDNIAHDLRTPLTRFRIEAERALSQEDHLETFKEALLEGMESVDHITALLNAIMDASETETSGMNLKSEIIEVHYLIERIEDLFQFTAEDKNIEIINRTQKDIFVKGDLTRLSQALSNLVDNAIKYSDPGSKVQIESKTESGNIIISVQDEGAGIEPEDLDKIWDRLYRADKSRSTHGLGIGLSVVKTVIKAHGGSVNASSASGKGSIFYVVLPICNDSV